MINSRQKGKRGELELVRLLKARGYHARRGQQFRGGPGSPDVVVDERSRLHIEVKYGAKIDVQAALAQARRDAGNAKDAVVAYRFVGRTMRGRPWWVVFGDEYVELLTEVFPVIGAPVL